MSKKHSLSQNTINLLCRLLNMLTIAIVLYSSNRALDSYTLIKNSKPKNISKVILPPEFKEEVYEVDFEKCAQKPLGIFITCFSKFMIKKFPKEYLINFYNNINSLIVKQKSLKVSNFLTGEKTVGEYFPRKNRIDINDDKYKTAIYHELFHLSSSVVKNGNEYCGFSQKSTKNRLSIGNGINEGYTQLLTERYFLGSAGSGIAYECLVFIADKLEKIIGENKMEYFYFNSNLPGLISELKKYKSDEEIMEFICGVDLLKKYLHKYKKPFKFEREIIDNSIKKIGEFLIDSYTKKLKTDLNDKKITKDEFKEKTVEYYCSISEIVSWAYGERIKFEFIDDDIRNDILVKKLK